jgi:hypothetical protein
MESVTALLNGLEPVDAINPIRCPTALSGVTVRNGTTVPGGSVVVVAVAVDRDEVLASMVEEAGDGVPVGLCDGIPGSTGSVEEQPDRAPMMMMTAASSDPAGRPARFLRHRSPTRGVRGRMDK